MSIAFLNIVFLTALSFLESIQLFTVLAWGAHFLPAKLDMWRSFFPEHAKLMGLNYYSGWSVIFLVVCVAVQVIVFMIGRRHLQDGGLIRRWRMFAAVEAVLTFLLLSAVFKIIVYDNRPQLATFALYGVLGLSVLSKVFWPETKRLLREIYGTLTDPHNTPLLRRIFNALFVVFIFLLIYVPDPEAAVARIFIGEQFHHWDMFITGTGWAYTMGQIVDIDVISRYGLGMPIVVSHLTKIFGGYTHVNIFQVFLWVCIIYYMLWYLLMRLWTGSVAVSMAALLVAIRVQMFPTGSYPFVFTYPSATPIRFCFDIFMLIALWLHLKYDRAVYLWLAGAVAGVAIFHIPGEGLYLAAGFYAYVFAHLVVPHFRAHFLKKPWAVLPAVLLPPMVAAGIIYLTQGHYLWSRELWANITEFIKYYFDGFGVGPIYQSLKGHDYLQSLIGFLVPLVYILNFLVVGSLCFFKKLGREHLLLAVLSVYGLGLYHYYVLLSYWTSYYMIGLPFIFLIFYWIHFGLSRLSLKRRQAVSLILVLGCLYALLTNHNYLAHPNLLSFSKNAYVDPLVAQPLPNRMPYFHHLFYQYPDAFKLPVNSLGETDEMIRTEKDFPTNQDLKAFFRREFDFPEDAALIERLTSPQDRVPVLSSFEIKILMQAKRQPFFYYFPLINSRPMHMRIFVTGHMFSLEHFHRTINQLEDAKPPYIFMERIFLTEQVPQAYFFDSPGVMPILEYVRLNYEPVQNGKYLVAMKRKAGAVETVSWTVDANGHLTRR